MQLILVLTLLAVAQGALPCASNQFTAANGLCQACPTNCPNCLSQISCSTCIPNFYLVSNSAGTLCQPCARVQVGCLSCLSNVACQTCAQRFFNKNGTCLGCNTLVPNCSNCSADGTVCSQCRYPYILSGNNCVSGTTAEIIAGGNLSPVAPQPNTNPTTTVSLPNGTVIIAVIDRNGCNQFQVSVGGKCFRVIANCQVYQPSGFCQICNAGYLVTIFGDCITKNTQLKCENGQWLNQSANVCVKASVACDWFYPNNGTCFNCSANYMMSNGSCLPKVACTSRQFYSAGKCVDVNLLCASFTLDGACTGCVSGYTLIDGICAIIVKPSDFASICTSPCANCFKDSPNFCFSCKYGFQLKNARFGTCIPIIN